VQAAVIRIDWARLARDLQQRHRPPLLHELLGEVRNAAADERTDRGDLLRRLQTLEPAEAEQALVGRIQDKVAQVLRLGARARPDPDRGWFDLGMDSLVIVELHHWLQDELGDACRLPATITFELPSISALARHVVRELRGGDGQTQRRRQEALRDPSAEADEELCSLSLDELVARLDQQIADATAKT
jgi:Phosphopantetheine attachment site